MEYDRRMRKIATPLALMLSALLALTTASASACDLSCWLARASSGCPSATPQMNMDMGGMDMSGAMNAAPVSNPTPNDQRDKNNSRHSMPVQMGMPDEPLQHGVIGERGMNADSSNGPPAPTCVYESCRQISASSSPPSASQSPPIFLRFVALYNCDPAGLPIASDQVNSGASPPPIHAVERHIVSLRI
jgi:hypothetical protein